MRHVIRSSAVWSVATLLTATLAGCAAPPLEKSPERLDEGTGTTVTVLSKPVELLAEEVRGGKDDPFAYVGPFETNQMGKRNLYLWVAMPEVSGPLSEPQVLCAGAPLALEMITQDLSQWGLSKGPYPTPAPWSRQWYFRLSHEALTCMSAAQTLTVQARAAEQKIERYSVQKVGLNEMADFTNRLSP